LGRLFVYLKETMPEIVLSPDGTRIASITPDTPQVQSNIPQAGQDESDLLRRQLGLVQQTDANPSQQGSTVPPNPQVQGTQAQSQQNGQYLTIEELIQKGLLDPNARHDLTKLDSYKNTVSKLQQQEAAARRQARDSMLTQLPERLAQRHNEQRQQLNQQLQTAQPHDRIRLEREFNDRVVTEQQQALSYMAQEQEDARQLEGWKRSWVEDDQVPVQVIQQLELIADSNPNLRSASDRYEFLNMATRRFLRDRALGLVGNPGSGQPTQQPQMGQPTPQYGTQAPVQQRQGVNYTPVVSPSGAGVTASSVGQKFSNALSSLHAPQDEQDRAWRELYQSVGIYNI
jgi:hypothetical protein